MIKNNRGTVLFVSLLLMITLSLIGFAGVMNSITESNIGKNFRLSREVFYPGDGALEVFGRVVVKTVLHKPYAPTIGGKLIFSGIGAAFENQVFDYDNFDVAIGKSGTISLATVANPDGTNQDSTNLTVARIAQKQVVGRGHCIGSSILFNKGEFCQPFYFTANTNICLGGSCTIPMASSQLEEYFLIRKSQGF